MAVDICIKRLVAEGTRGVEIAQTLKDGDFSIDEVKDALFKAGFVVAWEGQGDFRLLHVSDRPMEAGPATIIAASEPRALPSICWPQKMVWVDV